MSLEPKLIAPFQTGLQTNVKPWLAPEDAFEKMENAYLFRQRVKKKFGFNLMGADEYTTRTKVKLGTTTNGGFFTESVSSLSLQAGQIFKAGDEVFTIPSFDPGATNIPLLISGSAVSAVIDLTDDRLTITGTNSNSNVYFFPSLPIMGIFEMEAKQSNTKKSIAFDTKHAYTFSSNEGWVQFGDKKLTGTATNFFSATSFFGNDLDQTFFYAVNGNPTDQILYVEEDGTNLNQFKPHLKLDNGTTMGYIHSCKIIKTFANRLFALNTFEDAGSGTQVINYPFRIRFSPIGTKGTGSANDVWNVTAQLGSGWLEVPTREEITAAEVLKDKLIIFCENSIWKISILSSAVDKVLLVPFSLKPVNAEFGSSCINSVLSVDKYLISLSSLGIIQTDGFDVKRVDIDKIPDEFLKINRENQGDKKIFSIRDIKNHLIYFGFAEDSPFPDKVLCWNYMLDSWSFFDFSFTAFGFSDDFASFDWKISPNSKRLENLKPQILAGNQQGFIFVLNSSKTTHAPELSITNMNPITQEIQIENHNLKTDDWVEFTNALFTPSDKLGKVEKIDEDKIKVKNLTFTGSYVGNGFVTRVPKLNIKTMEWTFTVGEGKRFRMPYADFLLSDTTHGEITILTLLNSEALVSVKKGLIGTNVIRMKKENVLGAFEQDIRWHRLFLHSQQAGVQFQIFLNDNQMESKMIATSDFQMHAFLFYISRAGRLSQ